MLFHAKVQKVFVGVEVASDERVATLDVFPHVGEDFVLRKIRRAEHFAHAALGEGLAFVFEQLEEEREFGDFHRLRVDVHAVDVVQKDAFFFFDGKFVRKGCGVFVNDSRFFGPGAVFVAVVVVEVVGKKILVCADEKAPRAASGVHETHFRNLLGSASGDFFADGVFHDVIHDVGGGVIHAAGFLHFGLFNDFHAVSVFRLSAEADDFAEEAFVNRAQDFHGKDAELVWAFGVVKFADDAFEGFVLNGKAVGKVVLGEKAGVEFFVRRVEEFLEAGVNAVFAPGDFS